MLLYLIMMHVTLLFLFVCCDVIVNVVAFTYFLQDIEIEDSSHVVSVVYFFSQCRQKVSL